MKIVVLDSYTTNPDYLSWDTMKEFARLLFMIEHQEKRLSQE